MASDLEQLTALLDGWGVPYLAEAGNITTYGGDAAEGTVVKVGGWWAQSVSDKVAGYSGFFTAFIFTADGAFALMGAWE